MKKIYPSADHKVAECGECGKSIYAHEDTWVELRSPPLWPLCGCFDHRSKATRDSAIAGQVQANRVAELVAQSLTDLGKETHAD